MDTKRAEQDGADDLAEWRAFRNGDAAALERLVAKYRRPLFAFLLRFSRDGSTAEEWFQETWARALRNHRAFRKPPLAPWLFRIAHNLVMDSFRRLRREEPLEEDGGETVEIRDTAAVSPDRVVASRELGERIGAAVATLPALQRETFALRMDARLPFREIAAIQGCSLGTALARMQYALAKLRTALASDYEDWKEMR